jgi:hypothetical protein
MTPIIAFTALALLLPCQIHGDSPLTPNNRLLNKRGGAVTVKKSSMTNRLLYIHTYLRMSNFILAG